jgi:hypothetical protein
MSVTVSNTLHVPRDQQQVYKQQCPSILNKKNQDFNRYATQSFISASISHLLEEYATTNYIEINVSAPSVNYHSIIGALLWCIMNYVPSNFQLKK